MIRCNVLALAACEAPTLPHCRRDGNLLLCGSRSWLRCEEAKCTDQELFQRHLYSTLVSNNNTRAVQSASDLDMFVVTTPPTLQPCPHTWLPSLPLFPLPSNTSLLAQLLSESSSSSSSLAPTEASSSCHDSVNARVAMGRVFDFLWLKRMQCKPHHT